MAGVVGRKMEREGMLFSTVGDDVLDLLELQLSVSDRDTIDELQSYPEGDEREQFALNALRIGVLALRQARGRIDADLIQRETQRMLAGLQAQLAAHAAQMQEKLAGSLKEYFDPASGRFHERVQQLVKQDGELEQPAAAADRRRGFAAVQDAGRALRPAEPADEDARTRTSREGLLQALRANARDATRQPSATTCCASSRSTTRTGRWPA